MKKFLAILITCATGIVYASSNNSTTKTILAHTHTQEENILHQGYCKQIGGVDITDHSDIQLGANTIDAVFCKITDEAKYKSATRYFATGTLNLDKTLMMSIDPEYSDTVSPYISWTAHAANGTVPMYQNWWVRGAGVFSDIQHSSVSVSINVPDFACSASNSDSNFSGSATITAQVTCGASMGRPSTYDFATACVNGSCVQDRGTIFFR